MKIERGKNERDRLIDRLIGNMTIKIYCYNDVSKMYLEKKEEEDSPALKTALTHPYIDSKAIYKNTKEDSLQPPDTKLRTQ